MTLAQVKSYLGENWDTNWDGGDMSIENNGTVITANTTVNTKGSYSTIISSAAQDSYGFYMTIYLSNLSSTITSTLLDLRVGGSGGVEILKNWQVGACARSDQASTTWWIPVFIAKGSVVEARTQSVVSGGHPATVQLFLAAGDSGGMPVFAGAEAVGENTSDSGGVAITAGNGSPSTAINVGSTLSKNYGAVSLNICPSATALGARRYFWELLVSSVIKCGWFYGSNTGEFVNHLLPQIPFYTNLPSGAQLQARGESSASAHAHDIAYMCYY